MLQPRWVFHGAHLPSAGKQVWPLAWNTVARNQAGRSGALSHLKDSTEGSEGPAEKDIQIFFQLEKDIPLEKMFTLWHHHLNGHEFEQTLGVGEGQGSLVCCSPWDHKESDTT